jgi:hypothetical protein
MEAIMFGSDGIQLLERVTGTRECRGRSVQPLPVQPLPLQSEHFPVEARGREIVTAEGVMIAVATSLAISEDIARRLNKSYWSDQEEQWAL